MFGRFVPDFGRVVAQMQHDMYHIYTVDEHTIRAIGILSRIEVGELKEDHPLSRPTSCTRCCRAGALSRGAAARHRQGPRRRSFGARRRRRAAARPAAGPERRGDRDRGLAGALSPRDVEHRLPARHAGSQDHRRFRRARAVARAAAPAAGADRVRHPRRRPQRVERLEGGAAAPALLPPPRRCCRAARWHGGRAERVSRPRPSVAQAAGRLDRGREGRAFRARLSAPTGCRSTAETLARQAELVRDAERDRPAARASSTASTGSARSPRSRSTPPTPTACSRASPAPWRCRGANIVDAKIFTLANGMALDTFWIQDPRGRALRRARTAGAACRAASSWRCRTGSTSSASSSASGRLMAQRATASSPSRRAC